MANLMRNDVSLGKIAGGVKPISQFLKEAHVQVYPFVVRAVERTHRSLSETARGFCRSVKQYKFRCTIGSTGPLKHVGPGVFCITNHRGNKIFSFLICRRRTCRPRGIDGSVWIKESAGVHTKI